MPTYSFRNRTTGEEWEEQMSMSARETFLKENPDIEQLITKPVAIGDAFFLGRVHPDSNVTNRLKEIKSKHRGNTINTGNITEI